MRAFCSTIHSGNRPAKAIYVSTSGVYGDCGDIPVTEETPVNPGTTRARRRLDAETALRECGERHNFPVIVLRVTGIYGPDRLPLRHLADGQPVLNDREAPFTNRIHADDLARVCMAAAAKGEAGDIFNVSDGQTTTITEYFNAVADSLGQPRPRQVTMSDARHVMSPLMLSYVSESRRMDNRRMLEKLGVALLYPTLEAGLKKLS
jgi:nucleoside-diphosphate-sugar epimerase